MFMLKFTFTLCFCFVHVGGVHVIHQHLGGKGMRRTWRGTCVCVCVCVLLIDEDSDTRKLSCCPFVLQ